MLAAGTGVVSPSGTNVWERPPLLSLTRYAALLSILARPLRQATPSPSGPSSIAEHNVRFSSLALHDRDIAQRAWHDNSKNFQIVSGLSFVETGIALDGVHPWAVTLLTYPAVMWTDHSDGYNAGDHQAAVRRWGLTPTASLRHRGRSAGSQFLVT